MKNLITRVGGLAALALLCAGLYVGVVSGPARSQVPSTVPPYNTDLGAIITNSARTAGTVTSSQQTNLDKNGVACRFVQTVASGSPSTTFSIQGYDAATESYISLVTSGAITGTTPTEIVVYPGIQTSSLPTAMVAISLHLPRVWRLTQTIGGTQTPASTSKIGCNMLK